MIEFLKKFWRSLTQKADNAGDKIEEKWDDLKDKVEDKKDDAMEKMDDDGAPTVQPVVAPIYTPEPYVVPDVVTPPVSEPEVVQVTETVQVTPVKPKPRQRKKPAVKTVKPVDKQLSNMLDTATKPAVKKPAPATNRKTKK
jgi:hypothetical protein